MACLFFFFKQSGGEESRKSRLAEGTSSSAKNNGEIIDYKALYEATKWVEGCRRRNRGPFLFPVFLIFAELRTIN